MFRYPKMRRFHRFFPFFFLTMFLAVWSAGNASAGEVDMAVTSLTINSECQAVITMANQGSAALPISAYDSMLGPSVQFDKDNKSYAGFRLSSVDHTKALKNPGTSLTYTLSGKINGTVNMKVTFDPDNVLKEANRANNTVTASFTCSPPLPDLRLREISFTDSCLTKLTIDNAGDALLTDAAFASTGVYIQRFIDDSPGGQIYLGSIDTAKKLKAPGGAIEWTDGEEYKAKNTIEYKINRTGQEKSTENNSLKTNVPDRCKGSAKKSIVPLAPASKIPVKKSVPIRK